MEGFFLKSLQERAKQYCFNNIDWSVLESVTGVLGGIGRKKAKRKAPAAECRPGRCWARGCVAPIPGHGALWDHGTRSGGDRDGFRHRSRHGGPTPNAGFVLGELRAPCDERGPENTAPVGASLSDSRTTNAIRVHVTSIRVGPALSPECL